MQGDISINYKASPTAERFHTDPSKIRAVIGPVGGGKTVMLCVEVLRLAMTQAADVHQHVYPARDGRPVRPSRFLMVRATYPQLKATLIKTWNEWTGKLGTIVYDSPIRFKAEFPMNDGTVIDLEVVFMALDGPRAAENLRSLEVTSIAFSEFAEIGQDILEMASTRIGRYPKKIEDDEGEVLFGPTRPCLIMESNPPSTRSHWYKLFEVSRPPGVRVFHQPPAMIYDHEADAYQPNPEAENIRNLPGGYGYYQNIIDTGASSEFINVYVLNNYGSTFVGKPVYPAFDPRTNMMGGPGMTSDEAEMIKPERSRIIVGMDLGLNPAAAIGQENALGGLSIHDEVVGEDMRFEDFLSEMLIPTLNMRFNGIPVLVVYDPSNPRSSLAKHTASQMMKDRGLACVPAPSNDVAFRINAVNYYLQRTGMFQIHPRCVTIREGMAGGYHFAEVKGKSGVFREEPDKGSYSHVMNGVEYFCSYFFKSMRRVNDMQRRMGAVGSGQSKKGYVYV